MMAIPQPSMTFGGFPNRIVCTMDEKMIWDETELLNLDEGIVARQESHTETPARSPTWK